MSWEDLRGSVGFREEYDRLAATARDGDTVVQVCVTFGKGIAYLARQLLNAGKAVRLVGVDPWIADPLTTEHAWGGEHAPWVREQGGPYNAFLAGMRTHAPEELEYIQTWRMSSAEAAQVFAPASCRGVVIDGGHQYEDSRDDIMRWLPIVEPGGLLLGSNYSPLHPGAVSAVREVLGHRGYTVSGDTWSARSPGERGRARTLPQRPSLHASQRTQPTQADRDLAAVRRVRPLGGLCNRLRVILSYRAALGPIEVVWNPDDQISLGRFSDVFEPLAGVSFAEPDETTPACPQTTDPHPRAPAHWKDAYREIILLSHHRDKLTSIIQPPYSAMHIRRTDLASLARQQNCYTGDDEFAAWSHSVPGPIYLATDNGTTQRQFVDIISRMGKNAILQAPIPEHPDQDLHDRRNTDLAFAAIDLFACAGSARFKGTAASSFSDTIDLLRRLGGWWS